MADEDDSDDDPAKEDSAEEGLLLKTMTLKERISYAVAIGAKGKRYRRIVDDGVPLASKAAGSAWDERDRMARRRDGD